jgi:hypothetical protein
MARPRKTRHNLVINFTRPTHREGERAREPHIYLGFVHTIRPRLTSTLPSLHFNGPRVYDPQQGSSGQAIPGSA